MVCRREGRPGEQFHYVTGLGAVCMRCGLELVECSSCGKRVKRITITVLRGRALCLTCYKAERERGEKRILKEVVADSLEALMKKVAESTPEGFRFVGVRLKTSSKTTWQAEYEREDIFEMRCS